MRVVASIEIGDAVWNEQSISRDSWNGRLKMTETGPALPCPLSFPRVLREHSRPAVKRRLAALRMLFDWMVVGQVLALNPAHAVRGLKHTEERQDAGP